MQIQTFLYSLKQAPRNTCLICFGSNLLLFGFAYSGVLAIWLVAIVSTILLLIYLYALYFALNNSFKIDANRFYIFGIALINLFLTLAGVFQVFLCYTWLRWTLRSIMQ